MYKRTTAHITVTVTPAYLAEQSNPESGKWAFAYRVEIKNGSGEPVRLRSRYWHITDDRGHVEEVRGPGVLGEEPLLPPGNSYTYTSGCPLGTPSGFMRGHYNFERADGSMFQVAIPAFSLDIPAQNRTLN
ncbi:Co2+/Mg2+ efflux protein ApaG [Aureimonas fodinaquatilis]|uniref:Protein ApaG n=1 Tax=Aureimonas fodinaquatilis TaxID=2565783 RepID=A0A5B0E4S2_9HYPH|nr:Co2+/Mg2+ efflux protein ApaG [Aureimonas fodinaquatilis]KAA0972429.1 Co2+/Mg2+ efflux protein ApaG [Aureimonas fodinaquatilis]